MADQERESAYEQALRDEIFRARVAEEYTGQYSVLDALWWLAHPTESAPSSLVAPAARLRDLQHQLFSEHGDGLNDPVAASQLPRLEAEIRYERQAIEHAVAAARAAPGDGSTANDAIGVTDAGEAAPADTLASDETPTRADDEAQPASSPRFWQRPSRSTVIGLGITAALVIGVWVGTQLRQGSADASSAPQPTTSATSAPTETRLKALEVFDREQAPEDIPTQFMPDTFDQSTFRLLGGDFDGYFPATYAVMNTSGLVCLLVSGTQPNYTATCVHAPSFPLLGIRVQTMTERPFPGTTDSPHATDISLVWAADGTVESTGSGRPTPDITVQPVP